MGTQVAAAAPARSSYPSATATSGALGPDEAALVTFLGNHRFTSRMALQPLITEPSGKNHQPRADIAAGHVAKRIDPDNAPLYNADGYRRERMHGYRTG